MTSRCVVAGSLVVSLALTSAGLGGPPAPRRGEPAEEYVRPDVLSPGLTPAPEAHVKEGTSSGTILVEGPGFSEERNDSCRGFDIVGGPIPTIAKVTFRGAEHINGSELRRLAGVHPGDPYWPVRNEQARRKIEERYEEMGYLLARCELLKGGEPMGFEVSFHITEGRHVSTLGRTPGTDHIDRAMCRTILAAKSTPFFPLHSTSEQRPARIGQIILTGNKRISTESVLAHLPLLPGQVLRYADLQQAEKTLAELGLFIVDPTTGLRPTVTVVNSDDDSAAKDILIEVEEIPDTKATAEKTH